MTSTRSAEGRVLFVYPVGPDRDLYLSALGEAGFATTVAATVMGAAASLQMEAPPDVIVMELLPAPAEAWAFIERRCADAPDIPLVILTSLIRPDRAHRRKAHALGCAPFVAKPCSLRQLVEVGQPGAGVLDLRRVGHWRRPLIEPSLDVEPSHPSHAAAQYIA